MTKIDTWRFDKEGFWCVKLSFNHLLVQILCFFQGDKSVYHFDMWTYTTAFHFFDICNFLQLPFDHIQAGCKCDKSPNSYSTLYRLIDDVTSKKNLNEKTMYFLRFEQLTSSITISFRTPRRFWMHFTRAKPPYGFSGIRYLVLCGFTGWPYQCQWKMTCFGA